MKIRGDSTSFVFAIASLIVGVFFAVRDGLDLTTGSFAVFGGLYVAFALWPGIREWLKICERDLEALFGHWGE